MTKSAVITARVDPETLAELDRLGSYYDRSRSWLIAKAIKRFADEESGFMALVKEGEEAINRGDFIMHDQLIDEIQTRKTKRRD